MLSWFGSQVSGDCTGVSRRNFLQVGAVPALGLSLPGWLATRGVAGGPSGAVPRTSVVWLG